MPVAEATVRTPRGSRFLVQLCRHAEAMGTRKLHRGQERPEVVRVEWTDEAGLIEFTWGRCTLRATAEELVVELDVDGDDRLRLLRDLLTADLERFGQREGLKVAWQGAPASNAVSKRGTKIALVVAVVLAVAAHVVAGSAALRSWRWTSVAADVVLAVVALKIVVVAVLARRRVRAHRIPSFAAHARRRNGDSAAQQRAGHDGDRQEHGGPGERR